MAESKIIFAASSVISSTLNSLSTLAWNEINFLKGVPEKVQLIEAKLRLIQGYLKDAENKPQRNHLMESWLRELRRVAFWAQDVIEKLNYLQQRHYQKRGCTYAFSRYSNLSQYLKTLHEIGEEIVKVNEFIPGIIDTTNNLNGVLNFGESSSMADQIEERCDPRSTIHISDEDEVVGFDSEITKIVNELLDPTNEQLSVVSILGMGGIGKSTLARKVFNHSDVNKNFDRKFWITISQQYDVRNLLYKEILKVVSRDKINDDFENMPVEDIRNKISVTLKEKKYLIVIDDIWTTKAWNDINPHNSTFPNTNNGSRIILTSRNFEVGKYPEIRRFIHELNPLDEKKSWELLMKKAFPPYVMESDLDRNQLECFRPHLLKKCKGLPLALIVLGGYLSKHLDYPTWSRMSENVDWNEAGNDINISQILALSYLDLPNHLKSIFLYIAVFPEDMIIKSGDLIRLWTAEGFITPSEKYELEIVARMYLDQLYERGLIQVVRKNRIHGRISRIRIHDVLRDWGIETAKEEGFFTVIKRSNHATSSDSYRVAVYGDCDDLTSMSHLRSFLQFGFLNKIDCLRDSSSLRVFSYMGYSKFGKVMKYMKHMVLLRYISLKRRDKIYLPSSIGQLCYLQTLECRDTKIGSLPSSLWEISTLRHVVLDEVWCNWNGPKKGSCRNIQKLVISDYLGSVSRNAVGLRYTHMDGVIAALEEMKQIVHLDLYSRNHSIRENVLSKLNGHHHLEVLQLWWSTLALTRLPDASIFPPNILKLVLMCPQLREDPMPVLEKLPKLVVLKLGILSYIHSMHCTVDGFKQLKYLLLKRIRHFEEWKVDVGAMPNLVHLKLLYCEDLKMFPEELMEHKKLQLLEMGEMAHLYEVDYSRLENKGCKVVLANKEWDGTLSDFR